MDQLASGKSLPVEAMPVFLKRVRFHLRDDRLTAAPRPAARLVRLRDLKPPELPLFVSRSPEHPLSLDSEDGRALPGAPQPHGEEPAWSTHFAFQCLKSGLRSCSRVSQRTEETRPFANECRKPNLPPR